MTGYLGKATNRYNELTGAGTRAEREATWGPINATMVDFDPATGTATMQPTYRPVHNGERVDMPKLYEVKINQPRGGNGAITLPFQPGDKFRLVPSMRAQEEYDTGSEDAAGDWTRSFHLADMEAFPDGGDSLADPLPNYDPDNMHIRFDPNGIYGIRGSKDGKIKIEGSEGNIYALISEAIDECRGGFKYLALEPNLIYTAQYAAVEAALQAIVTKLDAMAL